MQPVVTKTADRPTLPIVGEVVTLQELNEGEGKKTNSKVEAVGSELPTRKMIKIVVMFQFADEAFHLATAIVEVENGLCIFFLDREVGCNDPVM